MIDVMLSISLKLTVPFSNEDIFYLLLQGHHSGLPILQVGIYRGDCGDGPFKRG